jgi:DtxR family Mn-dependent transcriptional regulator
MPTISVENYLKAIYHLEAETGERVKTKDLADALALSLPSATNMLKSLATEGLVDYQAYRGARLSEAGRRHALRVIRNHRLIEAFLVEVLGYGWDEVHEEAELLEHAISDRLADRIDAYLLHPGYDPHGDPIPTSDGEVRRRATGTLLEVPAGQTATVSRVLDQSSDVLRHLRDHALLPGQEVVVLSLEPFDGPCMVRVAGDTVVPLSRRLAARILVASDTFGHSGHTHP